MKVIVAGGGIGGLTLALALHRRGIDVQVYEAVRDLEPLGVGINILPTSMAVLAELDLLEVLMALGLSNGELCFFNRHGQQVWREARGVDAGHGAPQLSVHRGRLQLSLLEAVRTRLGPDAVQTGRAVEDFADDGRSVSVELHDRRSGERRQDRGDVLVGADGIHSRVRERFHPAEGPPLWNGTLVWRATSVAPSFLTGRTMAMVGHTPQKFITYPITKPDAGLQLVNWIAVLDWRDRGLSGRESWNRRGRPEDFAPRYAGWRFDWLDVPGLIDRAETVFEFPLVDRDPLPRWSVGRVTLLGDAAHPLYPVGSNGASQAIIDADVLARALSEVADPVAALARYEAERLPATASIVFANRRQGAERVLDLAEARAPDGFSDIAEVFAPGELEAISTSYRQLIGLAARSGAPTGSSATSGPPPLDAAARSALVLDAAGRAAAYVESSSARSVVPAPAAVSGLAAFDEPLPETGVGPAAVLDRLDRLGSPATVVANDGRYFGFVTGGTDPAAHAAAILAGAWDQNTALPVMSPVAARLDEVAARWVCELLGLPEGAVATFCAGASIANLTGILAGRDALLARAGWDVDAAGLAGSPPLRVVTGAEAHVSVLKALRVAGIGRDAVTFVPTDACGRLLPAAIGRLDDRTLVVLQAGNVNTGHSDPFEAVIEQARAAGAWAHVDGAFGLWAAASPARRAMVAGVELADSWATDAHKWLNVPYVHPKISSSTC